ncbi:hypothetical protein SNEBB_004641 [Seison nebaliae]|nr:hypothetical protein SNEBB_004641 [Seison nebaliae]
MEKQLFEIDLTSVDEDSSTTYKYDGNCELIVKTKISAQLEIYRRFFVFSEIYELETRSYADYIEWIIRHPGIYRLKENYIIILPTLANLLMSEEDVGKYITEEYLQLGNKITLKSKFISSYSLTDTVNNLVERANGSTITLNKIGIFQLSVHRTSGLVKNYGPFYVHKLPMISVANEELRGRKIRVNALHEIILPSPFSIVKIEDFRSIDYPERNIILFSEIPHFLQTYDSFDKKNFIVYEENRMEDVRYLFCTKEMEFAMSNKKQELEIPLDYNHILCWEGKEQYFIEEKNNHTTYPIYSENNMNFVHLEKKGLYILSSINKFRIRIRQLPQYCSEILTSYKLKERDEFHPSGISACIFRQSVNPSKYSIHLHHPFPYADIIYKLQNNTDGCRLNKYIGPITIYGNDVLLLTAFAQTKNRSEYSKPFELKPLTMNEVEEVADKFTAQKAMVSPINLKLTNKRVSLGFPISEFYDKYEIFMNSQSITFNNEDENKLFQQVSLRTFPPRDGKYSTINVVGHLKPSYYSNWTASPMFNPKVIRLPIQESDIPLLEKIISNDLPVMRILINRKTKFVTFQLEVCEVSLEQYLKPTGKFHVYHCDCNDSMERKGKLLGSYTNPNGLVPTRWKLEEFLQLEKSFQIRVNDQETNILSWNKNKKYHIMQYDEVFYELCIFQYQKFNVDGYKKIVKLGEWPLSINIQLNLNALFDEEDVKLSMERKIDNMKILMDLKDNETFFSFNNSRCSMITENDKKNDENIFELITYGNGYILEKFFVVLEEMDFSCEFARQTPNGIEFNDIDSLKFNGNELLEVKLLEKNMETNTDLVTIDELRKRKITQKTKFILEVLEKSVRPLDSQTYILRKYEATFDPTVFPVFISEIRWPNLRFNWDKKDVKHLVFLRCEYGNYIGCTLINPSDDTVMVSMDGESLSDNLSDHHKFITSSSILPVEFKKWLKGVCMKENEEHILTNITNSYLTSSNGTFTHHCPINIRLPKTELRINREKDDDNNLNVNLSLKKVESKNDDKVEEIKTIFVMEDMNIFDEITKGKELKFSMSKEILYSYYLAHEQTLQCSNEHRKNETYQRKHSIKLFHQTITKSILDN